jgi:hypothetical protein
MKTDGLAVGFEGTLYNISYFGDLAVGVCTGQDLL